ncbi:hypothetical protein ACGFX4_11335 [Kitasatospora sp. NPDC048365]|uniref:hypothetical protein n=1 Tax=Kitasatospora sp. NPDC048365 TaxID=3364050 RepID=UPI003714CC3C
MASYAAGTHSAAVYLCRDLLDLRSALTEYALDNGFSVPAVYVDSGCGAAAGRSALGSLVGAVEQGLYDTVIVPAMPVTGTDHGGAGAVVRRLRAAGGRVVEIPQ